MTLFRMNENMEFPGISGDDIEWLQDSFVQAIKVILVMDTWWRLGDGELLNVSHVSG